MPPRFAAQVLLAPTAEPARAQRAFSALGFIPGPLVGQNFSIEADGAVFEAVFGTRVEQRADGGVSIHDSNRRALGTQLPLKVLPASLQTLVTAVLFTEPPAYGPGSFA